MADLKNEFSWSASRENCFLRCHRQYYFNYYGAWGGWNDRADARTRTLYVLKQLKTRPMWAGERVHACLHQVLDALQHGRPPLDEEAAVAQTLQQMREDYRQSGEGLYWDDPKKIAALFEHEYEIELSDAHWKETVDGALQSIRNFYRAELFSQLAAVPPEHWLEIESLASFMLDDVKVFVQLDGAHREKDGITIYDWKTGRAGHDAARDQLAVYALYAGKKWNAAIESIKAVEFNVALNEIREHRFTQADVEETSRRILDSSQAMKELLDDAASNSAREDRFEFTPNERTCLRCNFVRVCPRFTADTPSE